MKGAWLAAAAALALAACDGVWPDGGAGGGGAWPVTGDVAPAVARAERARRYEQTLAAIEARRAALARAYAAAPAGEAGEPARAKVRAEARAYLLEVIDAELFPAWLGTPWGLGRNSTATRPHQPGMTVGCSYFVTSILQNAGFVLDDRYAFAQAPALDIQRSLARGARGTGGAGAVARFLSIPAEDLAARIGRLGDGLYLIGLSNHVAWVRVRADDVRMIHASYSGGRVVSDEPLVGAVAIEVSRKAGYFVSPVIVADDRNDGLIAAWLTRAAVVFRGT